MSISPVFRTLSGLRVSHLSFSYPGADPLFEDISFSLPRGWTALVGDNGLGKTTLMNLLVGALKPQQGTITPAPEQLVSATCAQNNTVIPDNLEEFGADWSRSALNLRDLLGIDATGLTGGPSFPEARGNDFRLPRLSRKMPTW